MKGCRKHSFSHLLQYLLLSFELLVSETFSLLQILVVFLIDLSICVNVNEDNYLVGDLIMQ